MRWIVVLLVLASVGLMVAGLVTPVLQIEQWWFWTEPKSILQGIAGLWQGQKYGVALIIVVFSMLFPLLKLLLTVWVAFRDSEAPYIAKLLPLLGKWSMLDMFVVVATVGCVQLGLLGNVQTDYGVYYFSVSVLCAMFAAGLLEAKLMGSEQPLPAPPMLLVSLRAALLGAGCFTPLMRVEKWQFWSQDYSLGGVIPAIWRSGHEPFALMLVVLVIALPVLILAIESLCVGRALASGQAAGPWRKWLWLRHWSMLDVFVLALVVLWLQLGSAVTMQPRVGFWLLLSAVVLQWSGYWFALRRTRQLATAQVDIN